MWCMENTNSHLLLLDKSYLLFLFTIAAGP